WDIHLLYGFLGHQFAGDTERHRIHTLLAGSERTNSAGRGIAASWLGLEERRRIWAHAGCAFKVSFHRRFAEIPDSSPQRDRWLLVNRVAEHPGLHALRQRRTRTSGW